LLIITIKNNNKNNWFTYEIQELKQYTKFKFVIIIYLCKTIKYIIIIIIIIIIIVIIIIIIIIIIYSFLLFFFSE